MSKRKAKMGRPPVADPRNRHIVIRVNRAESRAIRGAAAKAGRLLGEYVRERLLGRGDA
jgi:hypothetical protein